MFIFFIHFIVLLIDLFKRVGIIRHHSTPSRARDFGVCLSIRLWCISLLDEVCGLFDRVIGLVGI